jgi:hypothetical protein
VGEKEIRIYDMHIRILLDFAFFAKALSNQFEAGLLTYSILCAFPKILPQWHIAQHCFGVYSCATARDFHTIPF